MLEATFSPLIPTEESEDFYKNFYNQYCFIQINDILIMYLQENLNERNIDFFINELDKYNNDIKTANIYRIASGIFDPALLVKNKENRGISISLFEDLKKENIDPLDWYIKSFEFLMIYATCEQAIKEFLVSRNVSYDHIKENTIINCLFNILIQNNLKNLFIKEINNTSNGIISSQNQLILAWKYFTQIRHVLVHTSGRPTDRIKNNMKNLLNENKKEFGDIEANLILEWDDDDFFSFPFNSKIYYITRYHFNFFRNMAILIVESLERTIHPNEYKIENFDLYKL